MVTLLMVVYAAKEKAQATTDAMGKPTALHPDPDTDPDPNH